MYVYMHRNMFINMCIRPYIVLFNHFYINEYIGMARKSLKLEQDKGIAFYKFESIPNTRAFINEWYETLNALTFNDIQRQELVDEANLVFRLNIEIFNELEGNPASTAFRLLLEAVKDKITSLFKK
jgi:heme oxygenase